MQKSCPFLKATCQGTKCQLWTKNAQNKFDCAFVAIPTALQILNDTVGGVDSTLVLISRGITSQKE